jgi:AcrR family transcriptional regulator
MSLQDRMRVTKERIFTVAMELFNQKGFEATQVSEITEKAGIGKGTFFNYFPTKQSVFGFIGRMNADALTAAMEKALADDSPVCDILFHQAKLVGSWCETNGSVIRQAVAAGYFLFSGAGGVTENRGDMRRLLNSIIERGQQREEFKTKIPARIAALSIEGIYFSLIAEWARTTDMTPLTTNLEKGLELFLSGMRS